MLDVHFHILWGIDDGPRTRSDAMALARAAVEAGTTGIAATSHVGWDWPDNTPATLAPRTDEVRRALEEESIPLEVHPGAELALTSAVEMEDEEVAALSLGTGPWLLVEPPTLPGAAGIVAMFETVRARGHQVVIAHPERCPAFHREPDRLKMLTDVGMVCSITAASLTGRFGKAVKKFAEEMLDGGLVHNIASDAHDLKRRTPSLRDEMRRANLSDDDIERLGRESARAILEGAPLSAPPRANRRRSGLLGRLRRTS